MAYPTDTTISNGIEVDSLISRLKNEKRTALEFQQRKHEDWNDNYELYRNKVKTNRLTQRQAVNIPLMKETVKTTLSRIDDSPSVDWKELGGDQQKEIIYQEIWNDQFKQNHLEWLDIVDKKNVLLYGISTRKLNINEKGAEISIPDVFDVLFDPIMNPIDLESARFIIHQNILKPLREILADERYTTEGKNDLKKWLTSQQGLVQTADNAKLMDEKLERLKSMGLQDTEFSHFVGGDVIVNLTEHFTKIWNNKTEEFEKRVIVYANDEIPLLNETLVDLIGVDFWPFVMWAEDPEANDLYADSIADLVRTPNKVLNVWFSQLVENRTLRNFQMHWYDATAPNYTPQTYEPGPGRMLPAPGDPNKTIMPVNIQGLDETLTAIDFVIKIVERGSGATAIEKGVSEKKQITLGEVNVLVGKAAERTIGMAKFYRNAWYDLCWKWNKLMQANAPKLLKLYKKSRNGKIYPKEIYAADWTSEAGYEPFVASSSEQEEEQVKGIQKFQFVISQFPNNSALRRIGQKRQLEILDLTPQEVKEVEEDERQRIDREVKELETGAGVVPGATPGIPAASEVNPEEEAMFSNLERRLQGLGIS